jgi:hypothetical protein
MSVANFFIFAKQPVHPFQSLPNQPFLAQKWNSWKGWKTLRKKIIFNALEKNLTQLGGYTP